MKSLLARKCAWAQVTGLRISGGEIWVLGLAALPAAVSGAPAARRAASLGALYHQA